MRGHIDMSDKYEITLWDNYHCKLADRYEQEFETEEEAMRHCLRKTGDGVCAMYDKARVKREYSGET